MARWISTKDKMPMRGKPVIVLKARRPAEYPPDILPACVLNVNKKHDYEFDFIPVPPLDREVDLINGSHWFYMPPIGKWNKTAEKLPKAGRPVIILNIEPGQQWPRNSDDCFLYVCRLRNKDDKHFNEYQFVTYGHEYEANWYNATHWIYLPDEPERGND